MNTNPGAEAKPVFTQPGGQPHFGGQNLNSLPQQDLKTNMITPVQPNFMQNQPNQSQPAGDAVESQIDPQIHSEYGAEFKKSGMRDEEKSAYETCLQACGGCCTALCCLCILCECGPVEMIKPAHIGLISRFGKLEKKVGPGLYRYNMCTETILQLPIMIQNGSIPGQSLLTRDNMLINCNAIYNFHYAIPELVIYKVANPNILVQSTIKGIIKSLVAERTFDELQKNPDSFNKACMAETERKLNQFGIKIGIIDIKEVMLMHSMQRSMAQATESKNRNLQKISRAQGCLKASTSYAQAAENYKGQNIAMELNYYGLLKTMTMGKRSMILIKDAPFKK